MDDNEKFDKMVAEYAKPVKYEGIDGFFAVVAVLIVLVAIPVTYKVWQWAF